MKHVDKAVQERIKQLKRQEASEFNPMIKTLRQQEYQELEAEWKTLQTQKK